MNVMDKCSFILTDSFTNSSLILTVCVCLGLFRPQSECVAIEALQICTLLLPPSSRRKLQLLMRMMCRISQNVDMPRLHPAIGTRTLVSLRGGQQMSSPLHQPEHQKHFISHQKCLSVNIFRRCFHFLFASLSLLSLICYSPPPDGAYIFRLHPGQCCGV